MQQIFGVQSVIPRGARGITRRLIGALLWLSLVLLLPSAASAASPTLEYVTPGKSLPVGFTVEGGPVIAELAGFETLVHCTAAHGEGEVTGPRSTVSHYAFTGCVTEQGPDGGAKCKSAGAEPEEIRAGPIEAELVYLDRETHEVGELMNPGGGTYMTFECGGETTEARGAFLAPVAPVNIEASSFTATLSESAGAQTPTEYENSLGERLSAVPEGKRGTHEWATTGVSLTMTVQPESAGEIRAVTASDLEAKEHEEEAARQKRKLEEEAAKRHEEEVLKRHEEEAIASATAKRQEEEAAAAKRREEEAALERRLEAALRSAIGHVLTPPRGAGRIGALLRHGGVTESFHAPEAGALIVQWWQLPASGHGAKHAKPKARLIAQGRATFSGAGVGTVRVGLTGAGRQLLASARKLKLTARGQFTPAGQPAVSASKTISLRR